MNETKLHYENMALSLKVDKAEDALADLREAYEHSLSEAGRKGMISTEREKVLARALLVTSISTCSCDACQLAREILEEGK